MRKAVLCALLTLLCRVVCGGEVTGTWDGQAILGKDAVHVRFVLSAEDGHLTGQFFVRNEKPQPMEKIRLAGDRLSFEGRVDSGRIAFTGTISGRSISGNFTTFGRNGKQATGTWRASLPAVKAAPKSGSSPFAGNWQGRIKPAGEDGPGTHLRMKLWGSGNTLSGTMHLKTRDMGHVFEKASVSGRTLSVEVPVKNLQVSMRGELAGDRMSGTFTTLSKDGKRQTGSWHATRSSQSGFVPPKPDPLTARDNPTSPRPLKPERGIPAFPGAQGFGTLTPAGRGGRVIEVTSLADSGPGTLREALRAKGKRTVVFRVSGTIEAKDALYIHEPYVTVAGQTAPGDGICIKNAGLTVCTHDVLVQHLRIRPGDRGAINPSTNDAVALLGREATEQGGGAHHVVVDHVSASWSEDETMSTYEGVHDVTFSWCVISECLNRARHHKGTHSAGLMVAYRTEHVSMHHNLLAHNGFRNPLISQGGTHEFVNNVVYNWGSLPGQISDFHSHTFLNFIGNYYRRGPSSERKARSILVSPGAHVGVPRIYAKGNIGPYRKTDGEDDWNSIGYGWGGAAADRKYLAKTPFRTRGVKATSAAQALKDVLAGAGAIKPRRDSVDARVVSDVKRGTGRIIDSPTQVGGHPRLRSATPPPDSDHDGMPDEWERKNRLDPRNPNDGAKDADGDGYTNLEEYLHSLL